MKPAVYILCGVQFSGKSTLARILAMRRGWTHVAVDAIAQSLTGSMDGDVSEEQWTEAFDISYEQAAVCWQGRLPEQSGRIASNRSNRHSI